LCINENGDEAMDHSKSPPTKTPPTTNGVDNHEVNNLATDQNTSKDNSTTQNTYLMKIIKLLINFMYEESIHQFINNNGAFNEMFFHLIKACCNEGMCHIYLPVLYDRC
jgi:hypothetical protein